MSLPHCVSSAALDIEHGREGGHFALQKRPHNLVAPNAVAHIATSQKGLACTPRDPKCGRFFFVFLDFGQISPPAIFGQPWPATGGEGGRGEGGRGGPTPPAAASRGLEHPQCHHTPTLPWQPPPPPRARSLASSRQAKAWLASLGMVWYGLASDPGTFIMKCGGTCRHKI